MNESALEYCRSCKLTCKNTYVNPCDDCALATKNRADQIRTMTGLELAQFIDDLYRNAQIGVRPNCGWLEWLMQKPEK